MSKKCIKILPNDKLCMRQTELRFESTTIAGRSKKLLKTQLCNLEKGVLFPVKSFMFEFVICATRRFHRMKDDYLLHAQALLSFYTHVFL